MQPLRDDPDYAEGWIPLRVVLATRRTEREYAAVFDTIGRVGIFKRVEFGRPRHFEAGSKEAVQALGLVSGIFSLGDYPEPSPDDDGVSVDNWAGDPTGVLTPYGWTAGNLPDFVEDLPTQHEKPVRPTATTKTLDSALVIVAGLMHGKLKSDDRETAGKIVNMAAAAGLTISDDKVREVLTALPGAMARRRSKRS